MSPPQAEAIEGIAIVALPSIAQIFHVTSKKIARNFAQGGEMAKFGLKKAAEETGKSPSTIHRAMDSGRLSYELNAHGERVVDTRFHRI